MAFGSVTWLPSISVLFLLTVSITDANGFLRKGNEIKSEVFLSPKFELSPGSVLDKFYYNINFTRGHFGLKSFDAEVVDEEGNPVPLHETYLHHWVIEPYYSRKGVGSSENDVHLSPKDKSDYISGRNSGICQRNVLGQYFGLGSETRKTSTHVPDPYAIEIGNPEVIPDGFELQWFLNVHAIDTRGVEDRRGCTECRCDLYNVTVDKYGRNIRKDYKGGLLCCSDKTQCRVREGFEGARKRNFYLRYIVTWVNWDMSLLPVKIYVFDVTDLWKRSNDSAGGIIEHNCKVEYQVQSCKVSADTCVDTKRIGLLMPFDGYMVYGVAHQHAGGIGSALYREGGEKMCTSLPTYGKGDQPGDEAGYIVGMSTCYPKPGTVKITNGETLVMESNYSNIKSHTGVMGLFLILVADKLPIAEPSWNILNRMNETTVFSWFPVATLGIAAAVIVGLVYQLRNKEEDGYEPLGL